MKAYLMYRDRDFDPDQLIVRKEANRAAAGRAIRYLISSLCCPGTSELCGKTWDWTWCLREWQGRTIFCEMSQLSRCCKA